jgi:hypothetical protein
MRTQQELTDLFTTYFNDRLSPNQIDCLVADVMTAAHNRRAPMQSGEEIEARPPSYAGLRH